MVAALTRRAAPARRHRLAGLLLAATVVAGATTAAGPAPGGTAGPRLLTAGLVRAPGPGGMRALTPQEATGSTYLPDSTVVARPDGVLLGGASAPLRPLPDGLVGDPADRAAAVAEARALDAAWLAAGPVPGRTPTERDLATRALLDLDLLVRPDGAVVAGDYGIWRYTWPRDASWVAAALAVTGRRDRALAVLEHVGRLQRPDGTWEARYHLGGGAPVADGRAAQLDSSGWVPWAVWVWAVSGPADAAGLTRLWPTVRAAADAATASLDRRGLPRPSSDYWETRVRTVTVGTAAPLRAGLRAAVDLARSVGDRAAADRWVEAARRLDAGIARHFAPTGFQRTPAADSGADAAVAFLAPPFATYDAAVDQAVRAAEQRLVTPSGGLRPGERWRANPTVAWTPATGFVMLAAAASGRAEDAGRWLDWMARHRTEVGALPEKVTSDGAPASVAPLAWTDAIVLLTLVARDTGLPIPPVP